MILTGVGVQGVGVTSMCVHMPCREQQLPGAASPRGQHTAVLPARLEGSQGRADGRGIQAQEAAATGSLGPDLGEPEEGNWPVGGALQDCSA